MFKNKSPSNTSDPERHGLFVLFPPPGGTWDLDIVIVHGLGGDAYTTWTADNRMMWPRDFIPQVIPTARVMTFGYDSKWAFSPSTADIKDFSLDLLNRLRNKRWSAEEMNHPIMFICHSLGGIVCKQALLLAQSLPFYTNIFEKTSTIFFFGCPHRGSRVASWATVVGNFINASSFHKPIQKGLLADLSLSSRILADISTAFKEIVGSIDIKTFYETAIMLPLKTPVVERDSAVLGLPSEQIIPIAANHREMVRFSNINSEKFDAVKFALREAKEGRPMDPQNVLNAILYLSQQFNVVDYDTQMARVPLRYDGTCVWLPVHSSFVAWQTESNNDLLWLRGYAGVGKSVITKYVITDVFKAPYVKSKTQSPVGPGADPPRSFLAYFFCSERNRHLQSETNLLKSILHQLLKASPKEVANALQGFRQQRQSSFNYSFLLNPALLWEAVKSALLATIWETTYLVFDGLDEMLDQDLRAFSTGLKLLIESVVPQIEPRRLKVLITSRPSASLETNLSCPSIAIRSERDVKHFVQGSTKELAERYALSTQLQHDIVRRITEKAGGMFLWAVLAWYELCREARRAEDFAMNLLQLQRLPSSLEMLYEDILNRLSPTSRLLALKAFPWLTLSTRPLHINELRFALAMVDDSDEDDEYEATLRRMIGPEELRDLCPELISVGTDDNVQFVHSSIKDFFLSPGTRAQYRIDAVKLHSGISILCLKYFAMRGFDSKAVQADLMSEEVRVESEMLDLPVRYYLLPYAATNWYYHASMAGDDLKVWHAFNSLVENPDDTKLWLMLARYDGSLSAQRGWDLGRRFYEDLIVPPPIHIAVFLQNTFFIRRLIENGADVNQLNKTWTNASEEFRRPQMAVGGTVLHSPKIDHAMLQLLISLGADMNAPDRDGISALLHAVNEQDEDKVIMLLGFAKSQRRAISGIGYDPKILNQAASMTMRNAVIEILDDPLVDLSHPQLLGSDKSILGIYHTSPLEHACILGMSSIADIMIKHPRMQAAQKRLDLRSPNRNPTSVAFLTTLQGWDDLTLIAIEKFRTEIDRERDMNQRTILMHAALEEWHTVLETCIQLTQRSRLNMQDKNGRTALHHAGKMRNWFAADKLLTAGADFHMEDHDGMTPAHAAAEAGSDRVLRIMLDRRAFNAESVDHKRRNLLHYVATWNLHSIAETLVDLAPSQVSMKDSDGRTPAHLAALFGSTAVMALLLSTGLADINAQDHVGKTLLHLAVEGKVESCIDELLSRADTGLNIMDRNLKSPHDITQGFKDPEQANRIRIMLEDAGCRPGLWRPRQTYRSIQPLPTIEMTESDRDPKNWQLVWRPTPRQNRHEQGDAPVPDEIDEDRTPDQSIPRKPVPPRLPPRSPS